MTPSELVVNGVERVVVNQPYEVQVFLIKIKAKPTQVENFLQNNTGRGSGWLEFNLRYLYFRIDRKKVADNNNALCRFPK